MKYLLIASLILCSCSKEKTVTYVVKGNTLAYISYTDEFGNEVNEEVAGERIAGGLAEVNWKNEFTYHPDRFSNSRKLVLRASPYSEEYCALRAEIYVDNKKVADTSMAVRHINKGETPFLSLVYEIKPL